MLNVVPRSRTSGPTMPASSKSSGRMPAISLRPGSMRPMRSATVLRELDVDHRQLGDAVVDRRRQEVHARRADEARDEQVARVVVELHRRGDLLELAAEHDRHAVAQRHGLGLVVGHVDRGGVEPVLDPRHLGAHLHAQLGVEVRQRLVHQERLRVADDRAPHRDALALAAGQVRRLALEVVGEVEDLGRLVDLGVDLLLRALRELQRERDVVAHGHVRVQRVALEDHRDVAVARGLLVDDLAADPQLAGRDVLEPRDHVQRGRLPAARRPDEDHELPVADLQVEALDGGVAVRVRLDDVVENDVSHSRLLLIP